MAGKQAVQFCSPENHPNLDCICAPPKGNPRDFLRPKIFPKGKARGKSRGSREISRAEGMDFLIPPEFCCSTDILLIINPSTGMDQEIHPSGQGRIDIVKFNHFMLRMREWPILHPPRPKPLNYEQVGNLFQRRLQHLTPPPLLQTHPPICLGLRGLAGRKCPEIGQFPKSSWLTAPYTHQPFIYSTPLPHWNVMLDH